jgi:hypothetical protein
MLGPVHPDTLRPKIFEEVATAAHTGELLSFDKDRHWSASESETVLAGPGQPEPPSAGDGQGATVPAE